MLKEIYLVFTLVMYPDSHVLDSDLQISPVPINSPEDCTAAGDKIGSLFWERQGAKLIKVGCMSVTMELPEDAVPSSNNLSILGADPHAAIPPDVLNGIMDQIERMKQRDNNI